LNLLFHANTRREKRSALRYRHLLHHQLPVKRLAKKYSMAFLSFLNFRFLRSFAQRVILNVTERRMKFAAQLVSRECIVNASMQMGVSYVLEF
jgi:hypothetical protein